MYNEQQSLARRYAQALFLSSQEKDMLNEVEAGTEDGCKNYRGQ